MKKLAILAGLAFVFAGCSGGGDTAQEQAKAAAETMQTTADAMPALAAGDGEVLLAGSMGCGHCTFHQGDGCAAAMKTTDGVVYIFEGIGEGHELFDKRTDEMAVTVVGTTMEKDGMNFVTVREYRL